jgi:hypothetical protein
MNDLFGDLPNAKKKKKVDLEALTSVFKRIPGMNITTARDLMDLGFQDIDELRGRSPEALFEEIREIRPKSPDDLINYLRLAVYFAETDEPDPLLLEAWKWADPDLRG